MIYKKERDKESLVRYAAEQQGKLQIRGNLIEYRLSYLPELALNGKTEILEQEIMKGAPRLGLDMDILWIMKEEMYLEGVWNGCFEGFNRAPFFTTLDTAVYAEQYETLKMLLAKGVQFDLRSKRLREMYYHCTEERILRLAFEKKEYHAEALEIDQILRKKEKVNLSLLEVLYQQGFRPVENILDLYVSEFCGWYDETQLGNDPVILFFQEKGYQLRLEIEKGWDWQ